ncbi:aminopeptidase N C-terminal domain-containing protein, partial [Escherichia coli]|uniref:aminopeptidase N C-terminal domain-containing protein n=1 Tax=Escherichia coli TaxID=562 RepID=UPI002018A56A
LITRFAVAFYPVFNRVVAGNVKPGSNPAAFHAEDGSGYQFLVEMLTDLNSRNPQVASRLIEPLIRLKRYDAKRQEKMRAALEQLKGLENLSGDLYEKITKALA